MTNVRQILLTVWPTAPNRAASTNVSPSSDAAGPNVPAETTAPADAKDVRARSASALIFWTTENTTTVCTGRLRGKTIALVNAKQTLACLTAAKEMVLLSLSRIERPLSKRSFAPKKINAQPLKAFMNEMKNCPCRSECVGGCPCNDSTYECRDYAMILDAAHRIEGKLTSVDGEIFDRRRFGPKDKLVLDKAFYMSFKEEVYMFGGATTPRQIAVFGGPVEAPCEIEVSDIELGFDFDQINGTAVLVENDVGFEDDGLQCLLVQVSFTFFSHLFLLCP